VWSVYTLEAAPTGGPSRSKKEATTVSAYSSCRGAFTRMMHVTLLVVVRWWFNFFSTLLLSFFHAENISGQPKLKVVLLLFFISIVVPFLFNCLL
jgi:hypothetical protein